MQSWAIGVDIGGTKLEAALVNRCGEVAQVIRRPSPRENGPFLNVLTTLIEELADQKPVMGVGCAIPGSIDPQTGLLRNAPNSPAIQNTPLPKDLKQRLGFHFFFENDANCLVLSECQFGVAKGYKHVTGIILGTGVGAGVMHGNKLFAGAHGLAPEPGHMPLDIHGRLCKCGNRGCVEAYLSGPSILARYHEAGGDVQMTSPKPLFERQHDPIAASILEETSQCFARFVAALISVYDPQIFVLGGGLSQQPFFYQQQAKIAEFLFGTQQVPPILKAKGGDASGKLGAAALVFHQNAGGS